MLYYYCSSNLLRYIVVSFTWHIFKFGSAVPSVRCSKDPLTLNLILTLLILQLTLLTLTLNLILLMLTLALTLTSEQ